VKTDDLISLLAKHADPVAPHAVARRFATALGWGGFVAALLMAFALGVREDLREAALLPMFWVKLGFVACVALGGVLVTARLARPGMPLAWTPALLAAPVLAVWALAVYVLAGAAPSERAALVMGNTWNSCLWNVGLLSTPLFAALLWAMRGLAPTRLALSGAAAGLLAGSAAAVIYSLHCPELEAPFLAVWYVAAMLLPALAGALLGPRVLRW
jgi:hypothetical protein